MFNVCSAMAWTGWSKYTVASVTPNQALPGPFALPVSAAFEVAYVHMSASQMGRVEAGDLLPAVVGCGDAVRRAVDGEERVALAVVVQDLLEFVDLLG